MKKTIALLLNLAVLAGLLALPAAAAGFTPPFEVAAPGAYVVNLDTNIIVYEKNSDQPLPTASTAKVMTAVLLLEQYQDQLDEITVTMPRYVQDELYTQRVVNGISLQLADIRPGETHTLRNLLNAMLVYSGADAAMAIADYVGGGSQENFVYMMNAKARQIGCTDTNFVDAVGMSTENVASPRDLYLIFRYALGFDAFKEAINTQSYYMGELLPRYPAGTYNLQNTNVMIREGAGGVFYRDYCMGGKTGTLEDWANLVTWHNQDGMSYLSVVMNSPNSCDPYSSTYLDQYGNPKYNPAAYETCELMDWVFESFDILPALDKNEPIEQVPVKYCAETDRLMLYPADDLKTILPVGADESITQKTFHLPESVAAPVKQGDVIGTVDISLSGEVIGTVELLAERDLDRNLVLYTLSKVGEFFGSLYFKVLLALSGAAVAVYLAFYFISLTRRRGSKKIRRRPY